MSTASVTDRDRGAKKLLKELAKSGEITVGIHEAEGAEPKAGDDEGATLVEIAEIHEFGAESVGIPRRSFIRDWSDENEQAHNAHMRKMASAVITSRIDTETALKQLGARWQGEVQKRISDGIGEPLKQATIDRKGSSKQLIDTGQLRSSITNKVKVTG